MSRSISLTLFLALFTRMVLAQVNTDLRSVVTFNGIRANDVWGYAADQREYALVGLETGISIVEVTDPDNPAKLFFVPGPNSNWRDLKTHGNYAYVTNETSGGLRIINLSNLPATIDTFRWKGDTAIAGLSSAHNIFIDENGIGYIAGFNNSQGSLPVEERGVMMVDLAQNPLNPPIIGIYNQAYVHDLFVRNDTMWTAELYKGWFSVVDVADKSNPVVMASVETPSQFTHNLWLSDDGSALFTTDEVRGGYVASYDVTDVEDIIKLDRYQSHPGLEIIPHNVFVKDDHLVISYYTDGVRIVDASKPDFLVETAFYDTSPFSAGSFQGAWGVYPYLPSENLLVSDREEGLFIISPTYTRAAYLEGTVTDAGSATPVNNAQVEIIGTPQIEYTSLFGRYKTGIGESGFYDIRIFKPGCPSRIIQNVNLQQGQVKTLNATIDCPTGIVNAVGNHQDEGLIFYAGDNTIFYQLPEQTEGRIAVFDMSGSMVHAAFLTETEGAVPLPPNLSRGVYVAHLNTQYLSKSIKLIR